MSKAIRFHQTGGLEVLHFEEVPSRHPGPEEVLLKVQAVGLNRAESMYYHGAYMEQPSLPSGLGYEAAGEVTAVGPGVAQALVGKRFGTIPGFSMKQYPVLAEEAVVPVSVLAAAPTPFRRWRSPPSGCSTARPTARSWPSARWARGTL